MRHVNIISVVSLTQTRMQKPNVDEDAADDNDAIVDSSDDIPSRNKQKISSEMHVEAQRLEELKKRKKRIKPKPSPTQKGTDYEDTTQTATESQHTAPSKLLNLTSPSRSHPRYTLYLDLPWKCVDGAGG